MAVDVGKGDPAHTAPAEQAFVSYLRALRHHWRLVIIITLLSAGAAVFTVSRLSPTYTASASILVSPLPSGTSTFVGLATVVETGDPARDVQTAAALIDTPQAATAAAAALGHGWTGGAVGSDVSVAPIGASDVLSVTAQAGTASDAARVANAYARGAIAYRARVVQAQIAANVAALQARLATLPATSAEAQAVATTLAQLRAIAQPGREPTMSVSQTAQGGSRTGPSHLLVIVLALFGGLALGSVVAIALDTFSRPVRDVDELTSLYPLPVLATVPTIGRRARSGGLPPWSFTPRAFEQLRLLRVQLAQEARNPVIMVTSAVAGDGKTTVAAALAAAFAEVGTNVILMDLDLRKPELGTLLGVEHDSPEGGVLPIPELPGIKLISTPMADMAGTENLVQRLPDLIAHARRAAGCVIIDTSPVGEVSDALRIAPMCDAVVVVSRPRHTDRRRLMTTRDLLERAGAPVVGLVLVEPGAEWSGRHYGYGYLSGPFGGPGREPESDRTSADDPTEEADSSAHDEAEHGESGSVQGTRGAVG